MSMKVTYDFVYELMRAYKNSNLLVNKRICGGRVNEFLDIPNSIRQVIVRRGQVTLYQGVEFSIPFYIRKEQKIADYFQNEIESKLFKGKLLEMKDEEIEHFNQYWNLPFIGLLEKEPQDNFAMYLKGNEKLILSLEIGKPVSDVFEIFFKPIPYKGG